MNQVVGPKPGIGGSQKSEAKTGGGGDPKELERGLSKARDPLSTTARRTYAVFTSFRGDNTATKLQGNGSRRGEEKKEVT